MRSKAKCKPAKNGRQTPARFSGGLEAICFSLGRAYYNYLGLLERILAETGLDAHVRPGMGHVLFALFEEDDRVIKDIARRVQLSYSTLSGLLARMEKAGLIVCRKDTSDGRAVRVCLTPLARALEARCHEVVERINAIMLADLSAVEITQAQRLLARMIQAMRSDEETRAERAGKK